MGARQLESTSNEYRVKLRFILLTLFLVIFYSTLLFSATIYIDPTFTGTPKNGTITNPYSLWSQATITTGNTYLQKRGTTASITGNIWIFQKSNVTIGAYGEGNRPKVISSGTDVKVIDFGNSSNCILRDFEVTSTGNATSGVYFAAGCADNLIDNCEIHNVEWGIRITTAEGGNRILNSEIHNTGDDGVYIKDVTNIEIGYCHIYDVNRKWFINPDQSYSPGDCIQISSTNNLYYNIHHNILDHTSTGNKFCFISYGVNYTGLIEHNTMIGNAANVTSCIYFHATTGTVTVRYNTFQDGNYAIYSYVDNLQFHYNRVLNNKYGVRVLNNHNITALNNVFYGNETYCINSLSGTDVISRNNAFFLIGNTAQAYSTGGTLVSNNNNFNLEQSGFINGFSTLASWRASSGNDVNSFVSNPMFVNPAIDDFCLQPNSPCINTGANVNLPLDYFGTQVPQGNMPDVGLHEYLNNQGGANLPPIIGNQVFQISENSSNASVVGAVIASDPNSGQTLTYSITSGNTSNAFTINPATGVLTVANSQILNFESVTSFQLLVRVTDNGTGNLWSQATVTVNLLNINELPVIANQSFSVVQNASNGTIVGLVVATDPDQNQTLGYSITAGNTSNAFAINSSTGRITVANSTAVVSGAFALTVRATDNGTPVLWSAATVTITVTGTANQAPVIANQSFSIVQNSANGALVGHVVASDPNAGQTLTYSITAGNTGTAFAINASTGNITVNNSTALLVQAYPLTVRVTDNGSPVLWSQATVTVNVTSPANQSPVIANQAFSVVQYTANGTLVGHVVASDPNAGQTLTYSITAGNTGTAFAINASTGNITVNNSSTLIVQAYPLTVRVTDNGNPILYSQATVTINVTSPSNLPPVIANQSFSIIQFSPNGTLVGTVIASDPNTGQTLTYSITGGNTGTTFSINSINGNLMVNNSAALSPQTFSLTIRATDNGNPVLYSQATLTILVTAAPNQAPVITNQSFGITPNSPNGTSIGIVLALDPNPGQVLTYSITSGNSNGVFSINPVSGMLAVANSTGLNPGTYSIMVRATDNGSPVLWSQSTMTITVATQTNQSPIIANQSFSVSENSSNGTMVGNIIAIDPNQGQTLTYSIMSGNSNNTFSINSSNGTLYVNNYLALNYEYIQTYSLIVRVTDNGTGHLWSQATVIVNVINLNETPILNEHIFSVVPLAPNGTLVGVVSGSDPDIGQSLTYQIISGNTSNTFSLNSTTGNLTVINSSALNINVNPVFYLTVKIQDNGQPALHSNGIIRIDLIPTKLGDEITPLIKEEDAEKKGYTIYPNPSSDGIFNLKSNSVPTNAVVNVFNTSGSLIEVLNTSSDSNSSLNLSAYPTGVYILKISSEEGSFTYKVVKK